MAQSGGKSLHEPEPAESQHGRGTQDSTQAWVVVTCGAKWEKIVEAKKSAEP